MELPEAHINHRSHQRIRLKIASQRGNTDYFDKLQTKLAGLQTFTELKVNALTGSVLLIDEKLEIDTIASFAKSNQLFKLTTRKSNPSPLAHQAVNPIEKVNKLIKQYTNGYADLTGVLFVVLSALGIYDLLRGKPKLPPWYTAFWYAIGIFELKRLFEKSS
jgi:hypothetical protein